MTAVATYATSDNLKRPLSFSILFHVALGALLLVSSVYSHRGGLWGGPGGAVSVGIVGSVPGIPMPRPDVSTPSRVVDDSRGLHKNEPPPEIKPTPPDTSASRSSSIEAAAKNTIRGPRSSLRTRRSRPRTPFRTAGGAPTVPYSSASLSLGTGTQGGLGMNGAAGGNFGSQYSWYVEAVQRRISGAWLQSTVDPGISFAPRVVVTFDITRNGSVTNIQSRIPAETTSVEQFRRARDPRCEPRSIARRLDTAVRT